MESKRKVQIMGAIKTQLEDQLEAVLFEGRIASKIGDEKGLEAIRKRATELEKKVEAATALIEDEQKTQE